MKTKKSTKVIHNPELAQELKGFVPVFGSEEDLFIVERVISLEKKLRDVDNKILREKGSKELTSKMKEILFEEKDLIRTLFKRTLDF